MLANVRPARWLILAAFACVYFIWGSSYIGIHFALDTIPPFMMSGLRFVLGGGLLVSWMLLRGAPLPSRIHWRSAFFIGFIMFVVNNGGIVWAEYQGVPTGIVALLIATVPIWVVLFTWWSGGGRPTRRVVAGILLGFIGVTLLIGPANLSSDQPFAILPTLVVLGCGCAWAFGSVYIKTAPLPESALMSTGMQLLAGGVMQMGLALLTGELAAFDPAAVSVTSWFAMVYLAIFSSIIAFSAFIWLMRVEPAERVATYAYVNPVIAVLLGWLLAGETLSPLMIVAAGVIVASVILIISRGRIGRIIWLRSRKRGNNPAVAKAA